eukprot:1669257-Alexandrium_andersonii.AAC.1
MARRPRRAPRRSTAEAWWVPRHRHAAPGAGTQAVPRSRHPSPPYGARAPSCARGAWPWALA